MLNLELEDDIETSLAVSMRLRVLRLDISPEDPSSHSFLADRPMIVWIQLVVFKRKRNGTNVVFKRKNVKDVCDRSFREGPVRPTTVPNNFYVKAVVNRTIATL